MAPTPRRAIAAVAAVTLAGLAAACSGGDGGSPVANGPATAAPSPSPSPGPTPTSAAARFPGEEWTRVRPRAAGFDATALDLLAEQAAAAGSSCLAVVRDGALVAEWYWDGAGPREPREAFSVTKSVTSTLVGIAQDQGMLSLEDAAAEYVPAWRRTPSEAVTVEHLLRNDSGRHWTLATDYVELLRSPDKTAFALGLGQDAPPGQVWAYNNSAIQTLSAVLAAATGEPAREYAERMLFEPIGMDDSSLTPDAAGGTLMFMGLQTTCRDLARFGHLMLRGGAWRDDRVVSEAWVERATGRSSTRLNAAYGLLWWLNRRGPIVSPLVATTGEATATIPDGQLVPGAPADTFWALGFRDQIVAVIPSEDVVAVRMGGAPPAGVAAFTQFQLTTGILGSLTA